MNLMRSIVSIVIGYLILAAVAMGIVSSLFGGEAEPETGSIIIAFGALVVGSIVAGFIAALIAGTSNHPATYITLGVLIAMAARGLVQQSGIEPDWYRFLGTLAQAVGFLVGASMAAHRLER